MVTIEKSPPVPCHDFIIQRIADVRKIHTPEGIEALEPVEIGGVTQWISIRGRNRNNPVLLFIHGGPASPVMGMSWAFQNPWEDFFTVVQWDQRGTGKNALATDLEQLVPTLTLEQFKQDAEEMVEHLCKRLDKSKIFVMGYSWGSYLGLHLAHKLPHRLHAYIGIGQMGLETEKRIYERVLELAHQTKNATAIAELEEIAPFPHPTFDTPKPKYVMVRKWARFFNGGWYGKPDLDLFFSMQEFAPEYTSAELEVFLDTTSFLTLNMLPHFNRLSMDEFGFEFQTPIFMFMGRYDLHTAYACARDFFNRIHAPHKKLITFERSAHFPMMEEPGRVLMALINEVLPLAGESVQYERLADAPE